MVHSNESTDNIYYYYMTINTSTTEMCIRVVLILTKKYLKNKKRFLDYYYLSIHPSLFLHPQLHHRHLLHHLHYRCRYRYRVFQPS